MITKLDMITFTKYHYKYFPAFRRLTGDTGGDEKALEDYLDELTKGKEPGKVRIVLE